MWLGSSVIVEGMSSNRFSPVLIAVAAAWTAATAAVLAYANVVVGAEPDTDETVISTIERFVPADPFDPEIFVEALFADIPEHLRVVEPPDLPPALTESELVSALDDLIDQCPRDDTFVAQFPLGGGWEMHSRSVLVDRLAGLPEFLTAYTPYQAEASQGNLQVMFEYQTAMCELTGMAISNSSLYDGASAVAEGAIAALNVTRGRRKIVVSSAVHPDYRTVLKTYMYGLGIDVVEVPFAERLQVAGFTVRGPSLPIAAIRNTRMTGIPEYLLMTFLLVEDCTRDQKYTNTV